MERNRDGYTSPLSTRYASKEMQYLFSDNNKFRTWRRLWIALAKAERHLGLNVTQEQIDQLEAHAEDVNYGAATNTNAIIQNAHNDTDRVLAKLDAMEMARKDETIQALREKLSRADLAASQAAQNTYLVDQLRPCPQPAYLTCNPFTGQTYSYGSYGYNNGCGCNSGCCGCNG